MSDTDDLYAVVAAALTAYGVNGRPVLAAVNAAATWAEKQARTGEVTLTERLTLHPTVGLGGREAAEREVLRRVWLSCGEANVAPVTRPVVTWEPTVSGTPIDPSRPGTRWVDAVATVDGRHLPDSNGEVEVES